MYITKYLSKQGRSSMWLHISCICVRSCIVCICLHCACLQQDGFTRHLTKDTGVVSKYRVAIEFQFFLTNEQQIIPWTTGLRCIVCCIDNMFKLPFRITYRAILLGAGWFFGNCPNTFKFQWVTFGATPKGIINFPEMSRQVEMGFWIEVLRNLRY